jgi:hypothetical protein
VKGTTDLAASSFLHELRLGSTVVEAEATPSEIRRAMATGDKDGAERTAAGKAEKAQAGALRGPFGASTSSPPSAVAPLIFSFSVPL